MAKRTKMSGNLKRARAGMRGFVLRWTDTSPLSESGEINNSEVWHKNPTQRLICIDMFKRCAEWILSTEFTWEVKVIVVYKTERRGDKMDELSFRYTCPIRCGEKSNALNDVMKESIEESMYANDFLSEGHKNKGVFLHAIYSAEVVGV